MKVVNSRGDPKIQLRALGLIESKGIKLVFKKDYYGLFKKGDVVIGGRDDFGSDCYGYYVKKKDSNDTLWISIEHF